MIDYFEKFCVLTIVVVVGFNCALRPSFIGPVDTTPWVSALKRARSCALFPSFRFPLSFILALSLVLPANFVRLTLCFHEIIGHGGISLMLPPIVQVYSRNLFIDRVFINANIAHKQHFPPHKFSNQIFDKNSCLDFKWCSYTFLISFIVFSQILVYVSIATLPFATPKQLICIA